MVYGWQQIPNSKFCSEGSSVDWKCIACTTRYLPKGQKNIDSKGYMQHYQQ